MWVWAEEFMAARSMPPLMTQAMKRFKLHAPGARLSEKDQHECSAGMEAMQIGLMDPDQLTPWQRAVVLDRLLLIQKTSAVGTDFILHVLRTPSIVMPRGVKEGALQDTIAYVTANQDDLSQKTLDSYNNVMNSFHRSHQTDHTLYLL